MMVKPDAILVQEIKVQPAKAKVCCALSLLCFCSSSQLRLYHIPLSYGIILLSFALIIIIIII